jgi:hypothetical protein
MRNAIALGHAITEVKNYATKNQWQCCLVQPVTPNSSNFGKITDRLHVSFDLPAEGLLRSI